MADITVEEVETLIAKLDDEDIMFKQRAEILQKLQHIQRTNKEWLVNDGLTTLESTLIQLIKAKCCEVTGIPAANYNDITIEPIQGDQKVTFNASIKRDNSPPDAILFNGPSGVLGFVETSKQTLSHPLADH